MCQGKLNLFPLVSTFARQAMRLCAWGRNSSVEGTVQSKHLEKRLGFVCKMNLRMSETGLEKADCMCGLPVGEVGISAAFRLGI